MGPITMQNICSMYCLKTRTTMDWIETIFPTIGYRRWCFVNHYRHYLVHVLNTQNVPRCNSWQALHNSKRHLLERLKALIELAYGIYLVVCMFDYPSLAARYTTYVHTVPCHRRNIFTVYTASYKKSSRYTTQKWLCFEASEKTWNNLGVCCRYKLSAHAV